MKVKKVISLVLGGVMALSMLTACGGTSTTDPVVDTSDVTVDDSIIAYVENLIDAGVVDFANYEDYEDMLPLSGNETADTAFAIAYINKNYENLANDISTLANLAFAADASTTKIILISEDEVVSEKQLGNAIADALVAVDVDNNNEVPVDTITILKLDGSIVASLAGSGVGYDITDSYYVIVYTGAKAVAGTNAGYTQN